MNAHAIATPTPIQHAGSGLVGGQSSTKSNASAGMDGTGLGAFLSLLISQVPEADPAPLGVVQSETETLTAAIDDPALVLNPGLQDAVTFLLARSGQWQPEIKETPRKDEPAACEAPNGAVVLPSRVDQLQLADGAHFMTAGALPALNSGTEKKHEIPGWESHQLETGSPAALTPTSVTPLQGTKAAFDPSVDAITLRMNPLIAGKGFYAPSEVIVTLAILPLLDATPGDRPKSRDTFKAMGSGLDGMGVGVGSSTGPGVLTYSTSAEASLVTTEAVAEQVTYWINQKLQNAELTLDGAGLEPIEVSISLQGKEAHVAFRSDQAATRDILEGAMSHLKEMLASHGLSLSGASVGSSGLGEQTSKGHKNAQDGRKTTVRLPSQQTVPTATGGTTQGDRTVDLFV